MAQIFSYLPPGISHGLDIDAANMVMQYLQPYNTIQRLGYITTLAMAYVPAEMVDPLSLLLLNPNSKLYTNANPSVQTLMGMIDPSIPVLAGSTMGGTPVNAASAAGTSSASPGDSGAPDSANSSSPVRASSVGIGIGVVAGAALYGAAMFYVAKRYKSRKAGHQRSSSVLTGANRRPEVSALMSGGAGAMPGYRSTTRNSGGSGHSGSSEGSDRSGGTQGSGRTYISPPVMAENSLGWN